MYKIVLVGDAAVGKSNLLAYYTSSAEGKAADPDGTVKSFKKSRKVCRSSMVEHLCPTLALSHHTPSPPPYRSRSPPSAWNLR